MPELRDLARDRWHAILPQLGIRAEFLTGKHGPCPMCGGKDRWRFSNRNGEGGFICTHCGGGDGIRLVMLFRNVDFRGVVAVDGDKLPCRYDRAIDPAALRFGGNAAAYLTTHFWAARCDFGRELRAR
jgi:hypothetical protein